MLNLKVLIFKLLTETTIILKALSNKIHNLFRKESVVFLVGTPTYGNLGDQAIAIAELKWLKHYLPQKKVFEFTHNDLLKDQKQLILLSSIKKQDIIFLQGGGNLNDLYLNCEKIRRKIVKKCKKNKIIMFQQSICFSDCAESKKIMEETKKIYNLHPDFTIITREKTSYQNALKIFKNNRILLYPDMATYLFKKYKFNTHSARNGIAWCIRNDTEKYYSDEQLDNIFVAISEKHQINKIDTLMSKTIQPTCREKELYNFINLLMKYQITITDRFHGIIFSIMSGTPCIALRSKDHKIIDGVKWFKDYNGIVYTDNIKNIPEIVEELIINDNLCIPDFSEYFNDMYLKLFDQ